MNRASSWVVSAVIHGALLVGAMIPIIVSCEGTENMGMNISGDFICRVLESMVRVDKIDRPADA